MKISEYGYPSARIRGMKRFLLSREKILELLRTEDIKGFLELLSESYYSKILRNLKIPRIDEIERVLLYDLFNTLEKIYRISPESSGQLFLEILKYYEIEYIKEILSKIINKEKINIEKFPSRNKSLLEKMAKSTGIDEIVNLLRENKYIPYNSQIPEPIHLLFHLDKYFYMQLFNLMNSVDKEAREILGPEFDFVNIMTILRLKNQGVMDRSTIHEYLIPRYKIEDIDMLISAENVEDMVSMLKDTPYHNAFESALKIYLENKSLSGFEISFRRYMLRIYKKCFLEYPFSIRLPLGYLKLKENEIKNLRTIAIGISYGMDKKEIESLLII